MSENSSFSSRQMSEQEMQQFLADGLPLQDCMIREGTIPPNPAARALMERMGVPEAMIALWVDLSKRPDLQQAFNRFQGAEGEGVYSWVYLHEDQKDACYFVLDVNLRKPEQLQFHIPIRVADARWKEALDAISLMRSGMIIPITLYAGPAPDWHSMVTQLAPAQVREQLKQGSRGDIVFTLTREAVHDMYEHYDAWCRRFQPEHVAQPRQDAPLRFLIADVRDLTLSELAESLIDIAKQLQQMPQSTEPLRGNMRIDGTISAKSQSHSSIPLRFAITTVVDQVP